MILSCDSKLNLLALHSYRYFLKHFSTFFSQAGKNLVQIRLDQTRSMIDDISLLKYCSYQYYSVVIMLLPISHFSLPRSLSQLRHNIQDLRKKILFFFYKNFIQIRKSLNKTIQKPFIMRLAFCVLTCYSVIN